MRATRVGLVGLPALLRDLVAALLADDPGLELVPEAAQADVVVTADAQARRLLVTASPRAVIVLRDDGRRAELLDTVVRVRDLGEPTASVLRDAIHALAADPGGA